MAKTPEELGQIREHNRKELRKLLFDSAKWLSTQHAIRALRALIPAFGSALQAAVELLKQMRSGALPWATRSIRLRDGLPVSHMITLCPAPADLDAVTPENLITGMRETSEGDNTVVRCWDFVDLQLFNRWLGALAEQAKQAEQAEQAEQEPLIESAVWFEEALVRYPRRRGETITNYAKRLSRAMQGALVTRVWPPATMRRRYHEKVAQERKTAQEERIARKRRRNP